MACHGFQEENITILMDDGEHTVPTRENILNAYRKIVSQSRSGDVVFCHYSGMSSESS
jgi:metacaspase-1